MSIETAAPVDPDGDGDDLNPKTLHELAALASTAHALGNIMVILVYTLPKGCKTDRPDVPFTNRNGIPPGQANVVYKFPLLDHTHLKPQNKIKLLEKRFRMGSKVEAVISTSDAIFVDTLSNMKFD